MIQWGLWAGSSNSPKRIAWIDKLSCGHQHSCPAATSSFGGMKQNKWMLEYHSCLPVSALRTQKLPSCAYQHALTIRISQTSTTKEVAGSPCSHMDSRAVLLQVLSYRSERSDTKMNRLINHKPVREEHSEKSETADQRRTRPSHARAPKVI